MLQVAVMVLTSTKLRKFKFLVHRNKSLRNILKRNRPNIEPCEIPDNIFSNALKMLFIVISFRFFRYEFQKVIVSKLIPQAWSLAMSKLCGIYSNALDKSVKTAPVKIFLSSAVLQFSVSLIKTWFMICTASFSASRDEIR